MRKLIPTIFTAIFAALVAVTLAPHSSFADQFKFGARVSQPGDMVPQNTAQSTFGFAPIFGAGEVYGGQLQQASTLPVARKVTMVAGTAVFTFPAAFNVAPVCTAVPEGPDVSATANSYVLVTITSCTYKSGDAADVRVVDFAPVVGNPN